MCLYEYEVGKQKQTTQKHTNKNRMGMGRIKAIGGDMGRKKGQIDD